MGEVRRGVLGLGLVARPGSSRRRRRAPRAPPLRRGEREAEDRADQVESRWYGRLRPYETQRPSIQRRCVAVRGEGARCLSSASSRLLPMPGSPTMNATRPRPAGDDVEQRGQALGAARRARPSGCRGRRIEPAPASRRGLAADDAEGVDGLGLALDLDLAEVVEVERVAGQAVRHLGDHDRAGLGGGLHARGHVHRVAQRRVLVAQVGADVADHDRARC